MALILSGKGGIFRPILDPVFDWLAADPWRWGTLLAAVQLGLVAMYVLSRSRQNGHERGYAIGAGLLFMCVVLPVLILQLAG